MEVEVSNQKDILLGNDYFQISYPNQNYKKSSEYKQWRKIAEKKSGKNGKEAFCEKDNIIIYQKKEFINFNIQCPLCNRNIYQCKYCNKSRDTLTTQCCIKASINDIKENKKIFQYINTEENKDDEIEFYQLFFLSFIPLFFSFINVLIFFIFFFANMEDKNGKLISETFEENRCLIILMRIFTLFYLILITIVYSIFFFNIFIIIVIISLPFKLYYVRIVIGMYSALLG